MLASPDADPAVSTARLDRVFELYRREVWAPTEPSDVRPLDRLFEAAPESARILSSGTRLFALAAEDLVLSDFGEQRWKVRRTVSDFDASYATAAVAPGDSAWRAVAPTFVSRYTRVAEVLDRLTRFRAEVFEALVGTGQTLADRQDRARRLAEVARRWGIPAEEIGAR